MFSHYFGATYCWPRTKWSTNSWRPHISAAGSPLGPLSTTVTHRACHRMSVIRHSDFYLHFGSSHITWKPRFIKQEDCILNTFKIFMFGNNLHPIISSFIYGNDPIAAAGCWSWCRGQRWRCRRLSSSFINQTVYCSKQEFIFDFTKYILRQFVLYINGIVSNNWLTSFSAPLHNNYQQLYIVLDRLPSLVLGRQDSLLAAPHGPGGQLQPLPLTLACNVCNLGSNKQRR